jgi:hypothetical protein
VPAAASQLVVTAEPPTAVNPGQGFSLTVEAEDSFGNIVTSYSGSATVTLTNANLGGAGTVLSGTTTMTFSPAGSTPGLVTFTGLSVNNAGAGYTLSISSPTLSSATTNPFNVGTVTPPPPPPPPPTIVSEVAVLSQKKNKKGKPIGKPTLSGYTITFSTAMDQTALGNHANFLVATKVIKTQRVKVGKKTINKKVTVLQPIGFSLAKLTSNSVMVSLAGQQKFPKGGQITIIAAAPGGVDSKSHVFLTHNGILAISPTGKRITLVS